MADPPDLVVTDVMLPGLSGTELVAALRSTPATAAVPVLLLSARAGQDAAVRGLAAGADDYLVKPFAAEELLARMRAHLDLARSRIGESHRMRQLADAVADLNDATDVRDALDRLTRRARDLIGAHRAVTSLTGPDTSEAITSVSLSDAYAAGRSDADLTSARPDVFALVSESNRPLRLSRGHLQDRRGPGGQAAQHPLVGGWLAAPLTTGDGVNHGVVELSDRHTGEFTADDEAALIPLAATASVVLQKLRLLHKQTEVALTLQRAMLSPSALPPSFAARYQPAVGTLEVGGDWYDLVELDDTRYGVIVGDVVGRGLEAAAVMGQLRTAARVLLAEGHPPATVVGALDTFARLLPGARCATTFCATIDTTTGEMRYISAGHPPAMVHAEDQRRLLADARSVPLAVSRDIRRTEACTTLTPGSTLVLYTDGLVERPGQPITDGIDRVLDTLHAHSDASIDELADLIARRHVDDMHDDDVALLLYRRPRTEPPDAERNLSTNDRPDAPLTITTSIEDDVVTVRAKGDIDLSSVPEFRRIVSKSDPDRRLVLDLAEVSYLGSPAVQVLFEQLTADLGSSSPRTASSTKSWR